MGLLPTLRAKRYARRFLHAVREGADRDVGRFLDKGADVDQRDEDGARAILLAATAGHFQIVDLLLQAGAQVSEEDAALFTACCKGGPDAVKLLYPRIPDTHSRNMFLLAASAAGCLEISKLLVDRGADVGAADSRGWTPLMMASMGGHLQVAKFLLEHGARANAMDGCGCTALMAACQFGHQDVAELLLSQGANVNARSLAGILSPSKYGVPENCLPPGLTALAWASRNGYASLVKLLLDHGATVDARDGGGWTPLMWAALGGHSGIMKELLDRGTDPGCQAATMTAGLLSGGSTALMIAAYRGWTEAVTVLLDRGADPNSRDRDGKTALMLASRYGHFDVVRLLLDKEAAVNEKARDGLSALACAVIEQHESVAALLREKGAEEPAPFRAGLPLRERLPIPGTTGVPVLTVSIIAFLVAVGLVLIPATVRWVNDTDFSAHPAAEKELFGEQLSTVVGLLSSLVADPGTTAMAMAWVLIMGLVVLGLALRYTRWATESDHWSIPVAGRIGRVVAVGGLTLFGSVVMLLGAGFMFGMSDHSDLSLVGPSFYMPGYYIAVGALVFAFVHSGRQRFPLWRMATLALLMVAPGFVPITTELWGTSTPTGMLIFLAYSAFVLLYMLLMATETEDAERRGRRLFPTIARTFLVPLLIVCAAAILILASGWLTG